LGRLAAAEAGRCRDNSNYRQRAARASGRGGDSITSLSGEFAVAAASLAASPAHPHITVEESNIQLAREQQGYTLASHFGPGLTVTEQGSKLESWADDKLMGQRQHEGKDTRSQVRSSS